MKCPSCNGWEIGEEPWESWYRCPNCDTRPATAQALVDYEELVAKLEAELAAEKQASAFAIACMQRDQADVKWMLESLATRNKDYVKLEAALTLIADVAADRDGYTSDAEKLGALVDEIYGYACNPQFVADALKESE